MRNPAALQDPATDAVETREWLESLDYVLQHGGVARAAQLLRQLDAHARQTGARIPFTANTPYINTIPADQQPAFPGNREIERRIKSIVRWNAHGDGGPGEQASDGIGGHISTYASAATLYEVGFNHFFRGRTETQPRRHRLLPGTRLARHLRPRLSRRTADGRAARELPPRAAPRAAGCRRYPHPWLMPDFWQFPTVSMGLGPIMSIYQARFNRYLEDRGLMKTDEPEDLGVPRRRRDRRTGNARRHHAGLPREARQPDLRHQLQPAAARRSRCAATARSSRNSKPSSAAPAGTSSR